MPKRLGVRPTFRIIISRAAIAMIDDGSRYGKLVDDNPAVSEFPSRLALSHLSLGWELHRTAKLSEAEAE